MSIHTNRKPHLPNCQTCGRRKISQKAAVAPGSAALVCKTCDVPDPELTIGSAKFAKGLGWAA